MMHAKSRLAALYYKTSQTEPHCSIEDCSFSVNNAEKAYDTTRRRCSVLVRAVLLLRSYLQQCQITVHTAHEALKLILNQMNSRGNIAHWRIILYKFEFDDVHHAGTFPTARKGRGKVFIYSRGWHEMRQVKCRTTWCTHISDSNRKKWRNATESRKRVHKRAGEWLVLSPSVI